MQSKAHRRDISELGMWTVINRPLEKSVEKHNKHATRTMDCHLRFMIYSLVASCLSLPDSLCMEEHGGAAACRRVKITSLLSGRSLDLCLKLDFILENVPSGKKKKSSIRLLSYNVKFTVNTPKC